MHELKAVLHVDDDDDILQLARMGFEIAGEFSVHQCRSGNEALAAIKAVKPDLLLLDVSMPDVDGKTLLSNIRKIAEFAELPAVFMTAGSAGSSEAAERPAGVIGHILKPFEPLTIAAELKKIWSEHQVQTAGSR